jgi:hypothetical protein
METISTEAEIEMVFSGEQQPNPAVPIRTNLDREPNVNAESELQAAKAVRCIISIDAGTPNDFSDEQFQNVLTQMCFSTEPDSKVTAERDLHNEKQEMHRLSIDAGRQTESSQRVIGKPGKSCPQQ